MRGGFPGMVLFLVVLFLCIWSVFAFGLPWNGDGVALVQRTESASQGDSPGKLDFVCVWVNLKGNRDSDARYLDKWLRCENKEVVCYSSGITSPTCTPKTERKGR